MCRSLTHCIRIHARPLLQLIYAFVDWSSFGHDIPHLERTGYFLEDKTEVSLVRLTPTDTVGREHEGDRIP